MAATRAELIARTQMQLAQRRAESAIPARTDELEECLLDGCKLLAQRGRDDGAIRALLTRDFVSSLTFSTYAARSTNTLYGALTLAGSAASTVLQEAAGLGNLLITGYTRYADYFPDYYHFDNGRPHPEVPRYTINGGQLLAKTSNTGLPLSAATFKLLGALYIPYVDEPAATATTLPVQLEEELVNIMVEEWFKRFSLGK